MIPTVYEEFYHEMQEGALSIAGRNAFIEILKPFFRKFIQRKIADAEVFTAKIFPFYKKIETFVFVTLPPYSFSLSFLLVVGANLWPLFSGGDPVVPGSGQLHNGLHAQAKRRTRDIFRGRERELSDDNWQTDGRALGRDKYGKPGIEIMR